MPKGVPKRVTLDWVKSELKDFVEQHREQKEYASLVLDALKNIAAILVKELPPPKAKAPDAPAVPDKALADVSGFQEPEEE